MALRGDQVAPLLFTLPNSSPCSLPAPLSPASLTPPAPNRPFPPNSSQSPPLPPSTPQSLRPLPPNSPSLFPLLSGAALAAPSQSTAHGSSALAWYAAVWVLLIVWAGEGVSICSMPRRDPSPTRTQAMPDRKGKGRRWEQERSGKGKGDGWGGGGCGLLWV